MRFSKEGFPPEMLSDFYKTEMPSFHICSSGVAEVCGALSEVGGLGPLAPMSSQVIFWLGAPSGPLMSGAP